MEQFNFDPGLWRMVALVVVVVGLLALALKVAQKRRTKIRQADEHSGRHRN